MDFAAPAVFDPVAAAAPTRAAAQTQQGDDAGAAFAEHLEAENASPEPREVRKPAPRAKSTSANADAEETPDAPTQTPQIAPAAALAAPVIAAPALLSLAAQPAAQANSGAELEPTAQGVIAAQQAPATPPALPAQHSSAPKSADAKPQKAAKATPAPAAPTAQAAPTEDARLEPEAAPAAPAPQAQPAAAPPTQQDALAALQALAGGAEPPRARTRQSAASAPDIAETTPTPPQPIVTAQQQAPSRPQAKPNLSNADGAAPQRFEAAVPAPAPSDAAAAPTTLTSSHAQHAAAAEATASTRATPAAAQVASEIVRRFNGQSTQFELRLDPPELGRVEVRIEVTRDHRVTALVSADNPQALTELARHARDLEQSLQAAGLQLADNGLSFDLRRGREDAQQASGQATNSGGDTEELEAVNAATPIARPLSLEGWRGMRVDVMA